MSYRPRRSAHTPAANGSKWIRPSTRWAIYYRDDFRCLYCERVGPQLTLDHLRSAQDGGSHAPSNLVTCCLSCNSAKQNLSSRAWYAKLRARGFDTKRIQGRIRRAVRRKLDRARGRLLARFRIEWKAADETTPVGRIHIQLLGLGQSNDDGRDKYPSSPNLPVIFDALDHFLGVLEKGTAEAGEQTEDAGRPDAQKSPG